MTPMKSIRAKCLDCCAGSANEVRLCPVETCPLWGYRSGHRPQKETIPAEHCRPAKGHSSPAPNGTRY